MSCVLNLGEVSKINSAAFYAGIYVYGEWSVPVVIHCCIDSANIVVMLGVVASLSTSPLLKANVSLM